LSQGQVQVHYYSAPGFRHTASSASSCWPNDARSAVHPMRPQSRSNASLHSTSRQRAAHHRSRANSFAGYAIALSWPFACPAALPLLEAETLSLAWSLQKGLICLVKVARNKPSFLSDRGRHSPVTGHAKPDACPSRLPFAATSPIICILFCIWIGLHRRHLDVPLTAVRYPGGSSSMRLRPHWRWASSSPDASIGPILRQHAVVQSR
jgi:hypothetical protein